MDTNIIKIIGSIVDAVSFYDKMPDVNVPLKIIHNTTGEIFDAISTHNGLFVNGNRVSGCYYSWVYANKENNN